MIIIPIKWLFHWEYTQHFQTNPIGHQNNPPKESTWWSNWLGQRAPTVKNCFVQNIAAFGFPISLNGYENNTVTHVTCSNPKIGLLLSTWKERRKRKEHEKLQAWRHRRSMPSSLETEAVSLDESKSHVHSLLWSIDRLENRCWMLVAPKTPEGISNILDYITIIYK